MGPVYETGPVQIEVEEPRELAISWCDALLTDLSVMGGEHVGASRGGEHVGASQGGEAWMASSSDYRDAANHHASDDCLVTNAFAKRCMMRARLESVQP